MKRILLSINILIFSFFIFACSSNNTEIANNNISNFKENEIKFKLTREHYENANSEWQTTTYDYDKKGYLINIFYKDSSGRWCISNYEYDTQGNRIKEDCKSSSETWTTYLFEYDNNGNMTKNHGEYSSGGWFTYTYEYEKI